MGKSTEHSSLTHQPYIPALHTSLTHHPYTQGQSLEHMLGRTDSQKLCSDGIQHTQTHTDTHTYTDTDTDTHSLTHSLAHSLTASCPAKAGYH